MHKRMFRCILLMVLVFSLPGCGSTVVSDEDEGTGTQQEAEDNTEEATATEADGLSAEEEFLAELNQYCEWMDAEQLPEENRWVSAYAEQVLYLIEAHKEHCEEIDVAFKYEKYYFNLIYLNEDDIPELVAGPLGEVSIYTYEAGEARTSNSGTLHTIMDRYGYGASGNYGYMYLPKENVIRGLGAEYTGGVQYTSYMNMNAEYELDSYYTLKLAYLDEDGNVFTGSEDYEPQVHYYYCIDDLEKEISEEEYSSYTIQGDYDDVVIVKSGLEIMEELYQYYLTFSK